MHYLWIIAIVIMFIIILTSLLKLFLPKKVLGVSSYSARSWLSELGNPSLLKQHAYLSSLVSDLQQVFKRITACFCSCDDNYYFLNSSLDNLDFSE